jgi:hypothetical protein
MSFRSNPFDNAVSAMMSSIKMERDHAALREWLLAHESFKPHWGQGKVITAIEEGFNEIDVRAGKRGGKSELARRIAKWGLIACSKRVWVLGPTWDIVDRMYRPLWDEVERAAQKKQIVILDRQRQSRLMRTQSGGLLEGVSWAAPEQIEGQGVDIVITDESQYLTQNVYDRIRARLEGDWLWIRIGSPAEEGASFYEENAYLSAIAHLPRYKGPISWPTWANPDKGIRMAVKTEIENLRALKKGLGKEHPLYKQRHSRFLAVYAGQSVRPSDVALPSFDSSIHVRPCPYDPDLPVYLAIDPGFYPSYYAVAVLQPHPQGTALHAESEKGLRQEELWQIDEIYLQHTIVDDVVTECQKREWWGSVKEAVIDVASRQTNNQTGQSQLTVWQQRGHFPIRAEVVSIEDGINTHRRWLSANRLFHDSIKCPNTIREYSLYKVRVRHIGDAKDAIIDRNNHIAKALAYFLVVHYGVTDTALKAVRWTRQISSPSRRLWA